MSALLTYLPLCTYECTFFISVFFLARGGSGHETTVVGGMARETRPRVYRTLFFPAWPG